MALIRNPIPPLILPGQAGKPGVPAAMVQSFDEGRKIHDYPDEKVGHPTLRQMLVDEIGPYWWAVIVRGNGEGALIPASVTCKALTEDRREFLADLAVRLNEEAHHKGHWTVAWGIKEILALWRDRDGHKQVVWNCDQPWDRVKSWGGTDWIVQQAVEALAAWAEHVRSLDLREGQITRALQAVPGKSILH